MLTSSMTAPLMEKIRDIPDFPKPGIVFKDITPLLKDPFALRSAVDLLVQHYQHARIDYVAGIESRGFILGAPLAYALNTGFIPIRKPGKLPYRTNRQEYALEYGADALEIHEDAVEPGKRVLLVDDLLATGGTIRAAASLLHQLDSHLVGAAFLVELAFLEGRKRLEDLELFTLVSF